MSCRSMWGELPASEVPRLWLLEEDKSKAITAHPATPTPPAPALPLPWHRCDPSTHPAALAPVDEYLRAAGPQALLNIAAGLLTSLPGRQRGEFPPTSFTFGFQAF